MAAATVSMDSEGIYTGLVSPEQDLYSTLDQTSSKNPQSQRREKSVRSSHPYRRAAVCVGLLCGLLLTATLVLCVLYTNLPQTYSLLERDGEELRANNRTMIQERDQLQTENTILKTERDQLQRDYSILKTERDQLQRDYIIFQQAVLKRECKPCPQGWVQSHSKCYFFSTESKIWTESRSDCIKRGADLVIIESKAEQNFISRNLRYNYYWIGLSDTVTAGTWRWVDGSPLQGGFWREGDPNDQDLYRGTDCVFTARGEKGWMDTSCNWSYGFICETDALLS